MAREIPGAEGISSVSVRDMPRPEDHFSCVSVTRFSFGGKALSKLDRASSST